ncbi:site-specific integrase [Thermophagus xiamenensis]|uniref:Site-specific recombinase XerD n=1 Tax=Thermophagus xiamenensis TaxID=385682 RepID=A0A1I1WW35_9BACT|nr:site-specific integrase [Thermophagus xiamenensis]SFD98588.1 Site-specific recombinase XerD [Thermophagus xiamenensis]
MATIQFQLSKSKKATEKIVYVRLFHSKELDQWVSTKIKVNPAHWSNRQQLIKPQYDQKGQNAVFIGLKRYLEDNLSKIISYSEVGKGWLKQAVNSYFEGKPFEYSVGKATISRKRTNTSLFEYIEDFIQQSQNAINPRTGKPLNKIVIGDYIRTFNLLKEYSRSKRTKLDFEDINLEFYSKFVAYLQKKNYSANTVGKFIKNLKVFLNKATEEGINTNLAYKSHRFVKIQVDTDNIALTENELKQLDDLDLSNKPYLERVRDLFLVGCWTGLRFGDLTNITPDKIQDGFINIVQSKTGDRVIIPLHSVVEKILAKYNGNLPPAISNQKTNQYLKEIGKLAGLNDTITLTTIKGGKKQAETYQKWQLIKTHTARRSFATNLYKAGFPSHSIMRITGHKSESSFLKYIKVSPQEHAQLLAEFWAKRMNI